MPITPVSSVKQALKNADTSLQPKYHKSTNTYDFLFGFIPKKINGGRTPIGTEEDFERFLDTLV